MFKIKPETLADFSFSGTYLILINPERIPHLILVNNHRYFSLTNKKSIINEDFEPYLKLLLQQNRKLLIVALKKIEFEKIIEAFKRYKKVNNKTITCLFPLRDIYQSQLNLETNFIFELIPQLAEKNLILNFSHLNLATELNEFGEFKLTTYNQQDIFNYIQELNERDATRKKNLSKNN